MRSALLAALGSGALFGAGLAISGMTNRFVVLGFLDVFGAFDPTLVFVMAGAVAVTAIAFRFVLRMPAPALGGAFRLPSRDVVDPRLLAGAAIFGIGWGLAGFCPGPVLVGTAAGLHDAWIFVPAMLVGSFCADRIAAP
ncbi:MAG TPA: DUF6691 family protein [Steroidobacteraceae bacterium]